MVGRIKKQTALVLTAVLLASSLPETNLYAAETEQKPVETQTEKSEIYEFETESHVQSTRVETDELQSADETETGMRNTVCEETESGTDSETERITEEETNTETESNTQSTAEEESESVGESEVETETEPESVSEVEPETEIETDPESTVEEEIEYPCPEALEPENVPYDENQSALTDALVNNRRARSTIPTKYDARQEGYLPAVRDQGRWGACWSFSLTGALEVSAVRDIGAVADGIDLSERHLAYFGYNTGYDALDNANKDTMTSPADYYLTNGGNDIRGVVRLMNWNGGADEDAYPYVTSSLPDALERTAAQNAKLYLENAYRYNFAEETDKDEAVNVVKKMIMDYGAVSWSYYNDAKYVNESTGAYYNNAGGSGSAKTNHAIMAVGWDDDYPKENFREDIMPENNGAWIIRNSWGANRGDDGYYYMSYEDVSLGSGNPVYAVTVCDSGKYDNNYFYGNTAFSSKTIAVRRAAQVYQMKSENAEREKLTAVSFLIGTSNVDYEIQIYKNPVRKDGVVTDPTSGTAMLDAPQTGTTTYAGMHTIELTTPIVLDTDDFVAVVLTFPDTKPSMYFDRSYTSDDRSCKGEHVIAKGQSFYGADLNSWQDNYNNNRTFRINVLTKNCDDVVYVPEIKEAEVQKAQDFTQNPRVHIRWSKCTGADSYKLYRSENNNDYQLIYTADSSVRAYTDILSERKAGQYFYKVEALYGNRTETSKVVSRRVESAIDAPKLVLSSYDGYKAVFTWNSIGGADSYELWQLSGDGSEGGKEVHVADFAAGEEHSYTIDTDGWELGNYTYKMCAVHDGEQTQWGEACIYRNLIWTQNSYYRAYFEWLPVKGAVSYKLFHKVNGKTFSATVNDVKALMSMNSASYLPCDEHQYYVNAYDAAGKVIDTSTTITFRLVPDALVIESIEYDYANTTALTWSGGLGAEKIAIYRSENLSDDGERIAEVTADTNAEALHYYDKVYKGKTYYYSLLPIAIDHNGEPVEGKPVKYDKILTFPEAAIIETAQYTEESGVNLAWKEAKGAEGYLLERSDNAGKFSEITAIEGGAVTAYADKNVQRGNRYQYRILSYYTAEDKSRAVISPSDAATVEVLPEPMKISEITELKRENNRTRVSLSWDTVENAQSYAVYRSAASKQEAGSYACIADQITDRQYIDNTAAPDTSYCYKVIVTMNGLSSDPEQTTAERILTKPVLKALRMSADTVALTKDAKQEFKIVPIPAHYPYEKELVWTAFDENENPLEVVQKNDTIVINGTDGKEAFYLSDNTMHVVRDSDTAEITLKAQIDEISAQCSIFLYNNDFWVRGVKDLTYTGGKLTQDIAVYDGKQLLTEGVDYTVSYKNNVKVSTGQTVSSKKPAVIVKGKGSYTGTQTIPFEILPEPASDADKRSVLKVKVKNIGTITYEGTDVKPKPVITDGKKTLVEGTDYTLSYNNNKGAGKATVTISGINDYKGTRKVSFTINCNMQNERLVHITLDTRNVPYAKGGAKPAVKVQCGSRLLKEGIDYKVSYKNNKAIASVSGAKAPTVVITGKGYYKGKREAAFNIVQQDIGNLTLTPKVRTYTGKAGKYTTSFVITDTDGKNLSAGKDYDKASVVYTYAETGEPVGATDIVERGTTLRITVSAAKTGAYRGTVSGEYRISSYDIAKAKVTVAAQTYTGSAIKPDSASGVLVTYNGYGSGLTEGVDYIITGYDNNTNKGTAKLYITGIGGFGGTKTVRFKIQTRPFQWWWQN